MQLTTAGLCCCKVGSVWKLVVLAIETGGRCTEAAVQVLRHLSHAEAREVPSFMSFAGGRECSQLRAQLLLQLRWWNRRATSRGVTLEGRLSLGRFVRGRSHVAGLSASRRDCLFLCVFEKKQGKRQVWNRGGLSDRLREDLVDARNTDGSAIVWRGDLGIAPHLQVVKILGAPRSHEASVPGQLQATAVARPCRANFHMRIQLWHWFLQPFTMLVAEVLPQCVGMGRPRSAKDVATLPVRGLGLRSASLAGPTACPQAENDTLWSRQIVGGSSLKRVARFPLARRCCC